MKTYVCVLREFDEPRVVDDVTELTFLSLDGRRMLSVYETADIAAVREKDTLPVKRMFTAQMWRDLLKLGPGAPPGKRAIVVVERYYDPASVEELLQRARDRYAPCFNVNRVDLVDSYMPTQEYEVGGVCVYAAPDAETLRRANQTVGFDFEHLWTARVYEPS